MPLEIDSSPAGRTAAAGLAGEEAVKDVTTASFRQDVLNESLKRPVLVDFWAPWCGPCRQLAPVLEKAVKAAGGKVALVKMNIDEHPQIAGQLGIQSIPAVIAFSQGQPADGFTGALPESQIRAFLERLVGPTGPTPSQELAAAAEEAAAQGDAAGAAQLYAMLLEAEPGHAGALAGLARLELDAGNLAGARGLLAEIPEGNASAAVAAVRAALDLAEQAADLGDIPSLEAKVQANPGDHQSRFDLAVALNARQKRGEALDHLLAIVKSDRSWNDDAARRQILQLFDAWGPVDPATLAGRRKLSTALFA